MKGAAVYALYVWVGACIAALYTLQCDLNNLIYALVFSFNNENCSRGKKLWGRSDHQTKASF